MLKWDSYSSVCRAPLLTVKSMKKSASHRESNVSAFSYLRCKLLDIFQIIVHRSIIPTLYRNLLQINPGKHQMMHEYRDQCPAHCHASWHIKNRLCQAN